ncbi:MAG: hypothetical protein PHW56_03825 [Methanosarcinaceae archaeon]|nr:hypothetical protein [Methanosarcinaceae archaeon]
MEEFFKGLIERACYYEQFESFRDECVSGKVRNIRDSDLKLKSPVANYP